MSSRLYWAVVAGLLAVYGALYLRTLDYELVWDDLPALNGQSPRDLHLHSVVLGALAIGLTSAVARRWLGHDGKALMVAGVFALHPLQVESIAYVSARGELVATLLALAALWLLLRGADQGAGRSRWPWLLSCALALGLAVLAKAALWSGPAIDARAVADAALILPGLWLQYLSILLLPNDLTIVRPLTSLWLIPGFLAWLTVLGGLALASRGAHDDRMRLVRHALAGAAFSLLALAPSALAVETSRVVADRYAFLPIVGYAVAVISAGHWLSVAAPAAARPLRVLAAGLALACLCVTALQVPVWRDAKTLYLNALMIERGSSSAAYGLGLAHARDGNGSFAYPLFVRAVDLDPNNAKAWHNIVVGAFTLGDYAGALSAADRAVVVSNTSSPALYNLATAHLQLGQAREGCAALGRALEHDPSHRQARELMATSCADAN